jgi:hypothetical protein
MGERTQAQIAATERMQAAAAEKRSAAQRTADAIANHRLVFDENNSLQQAALSSQNSGSGALEGAAPPISMDPENLNRANSLVQEIRPEGEARVDRVVPKQTPEWYEVIAERTPAHLGLPDQVQVAIENGFEISPGQDVGPTTIRVRLRIPYEEYLARIKAGEKKAEINRRAQNPDASIDKTQRTAIDLQELFTATEGSDTEAEKRLVSEKLTGR